MIELRYMHIKENINELYDYSYRYRFTRTEKADTEQRGKRQMSKDIFSPINIGNVTLKNRVVMAAMELGFCNETRGYINQHMLDFFSQHAKGGPGLIIVGGGQIDPVNYTDRDMVCVSEDDAKSGLRQLTDVIHREDCKVFLQLMHSGRYAPSAIYHGIGPVAPSPIASRLTGEVPHELTCDEIQQLIRFYADAALRAKEAGFDGIEICTNSGYLIGEFLSPLTNKRQDKYGGNLSGRMTFLCEIISAVKVSAGADFAISVRIGGSDFMPGGNTLTDAVYIAQTLEKLGVNMISVTGGWHETPVPQVTMEVPAGAFAYLGAAIHKAVSIPVAMSNRLDMKAASRIIKDDMADMAVLARAFLADPACAKKAENDQFESIRPCVGCNQGCLDNILRHKPVKCLVNASVGKEPELMEKGRLPEESAAAAKKRLLVIGAGPAGLEFARAASQRGHAVTVLEKDAEPGGQLRLAAAPPGRKDFEKFIRYLYHACIHNGVQFLFNTEANEETLTKQMEAKVFDRIILASGAHPSQPKFTVTFGANVVQAWDVLSGKADVGSSVFIIGGGAVGVETAMYLADIGTLSPEQLSFLFMNNAEAADRLRELMTKGTKRITIAEMDRKIGKDIGLTSRWGMISRLKQADVNILTNTRVEKITSDGVQVISDDGSHQFFAAETIVLATGSHPNDHLINTLRKFSDWITVIGDSSGPAKAMDAVSDAYYAAIRLD